MRVEMLGTAFTAQHSDSRVLDQLIYKWSHSRAIIAEAISKTEQQNAQCGNIAHHGTCKTFKGFLESPSNVEPSVSQKA
eukprot:4316942-Amphidinium_carterae.1